MKIYYSPKFEKDYRKLPTSIKTKVKNKTKIFRSNPYTSQLKTHKLMGSLKDYWSFSVDYSYRIIFQFNEGNMVWFHSVGTHEIYE